MTIAIVTLSVVIVIGLILILLVATYNHFQDYIITGGMPLYRSSLGDPSWLSAG